MSVILEALRKSGGSRVMPAEFSRQDTAIRSERKVKKFFMSGTAAVFLCITLLLIFNGIYFWRHRGTDSSLTRPADNPSFRRGSSVSAKPEASSHGYTLTGLINEDQPFAVINDRVVSAGEKVDAALVKEIQGRRVILEFEGREIQLAI